jgi:RNA polymerase sigma-70 factor (ECF subfamily)
MWSRRKDERTESTAPAPVERLGAADRDEDVLIDRTLAGETDAFGELVLRYQDRLYGTLVHVGGCPDEAREITQEAFVQAFVKLAGFQRTAAFYTWLFRIAFNLRIGRRRRERRHRAWQEEARLRAQADGQVDDPSLPLESAECVVRVRAAIDDLADDHREVLILREMEGCCYEEIADILDVPLGTVRSRLHRARAHLRDKLRPIHHEQRR